MPAPIRATILDFNGVIVDDEVVHFELFREALATEGVTLDEETYHDRYLGYDDRGCFSAALSDAGLDPGPARIAALIARKAARYVEVADAGLAYFPGAADAIAGLADRGPLAICSGALRAEIEHALGRLGVRGRVVAIASAEDTSRCKPDPEGYLVALGRLRATTQDLAAAECLVVEDSLAGLAAARAAGMIAVGVGPTYRPDELTAAGAVAVVDGLASVTPGWVDALSARLDLDRPDGTTERPTGATSVDTTPPPPAPTGLLLSRDLIFTSKVTGTARLLGRAVATAGGRSLAMTLIADRRPAVVFLDLAAGDLVDPAAIAAYREAAGPSIEFVAFGSHVDTAGLAAAEAAGCGLVLPRSRFSAELPALIRRFLGADETGNP